jgi:hypothetical protein
LYLQRKHSIALRSSKKNKYPFELLSVISISGLKKLLEKKISKMTLGDIELKVYFS